MSQKIVQGRAAMMFGAAAAMALGLVAWSGMTVSAQAPGGRAGGAPAGPPPTAQSTAAIDLTGNWVSVVNEDWRWRMVTPPKGDYASVPLNADGTKVTSPQTLLDSLLGKLSFDPLAFAKMTPRQQAWLDVFGGIFFLMPMAVIIGWLSIPMVINSFRIWEHSNDPGGLLRCRAQRRHRGLSVSGRQSRRFCRAVFAGTPIVRCSE